MRLSWFFLLAVIVASAFGFSSGSAAAPSGRGQGSERAVEQAAEYVSEGAQALEAQNIPRAYEQLKTGVGHPGFSGLPEDTQRAAHYLFGLAAYDHEQFKEALSALRTSSEGEGAVALDWYFRLLAAVAAKDEREVVHTLTVVARSFPASLAELSDSWIARTASSRGFPDIPDRDKRRFELVSALLAGWKPEEPSMGDELWRDHALALVERNELERAGEAAARVMSVRSLIAMRADKRLDAVIAANPAHFDIARAAERQLSVAQARAATHPNQLAPRNEVAGMLLLLGRYDAALKASDEARALALPADGSSSTLTDLSSTLNWTLDLRARILSAMGRHDEALVELKRAARRPENGNVNVSQALNLGSSHNDRGEFVEALAEVEDLTPGEMSPYGRMVLDKVKACAAFQLGRKAAAAPLLARLRTHWRDGPGPARAALLCAEDLDGAASLITQQLGDAELRGEALLAFQNLTIEPSLPSFEARMDARWTAVKARPDVRRALDVVGRAGTYALSDGDL